MTLVHIIGGQWGDEGKGKIVDFIAQLLKPDFGVRFNGGANAGHSIANEKGEVVLHLIPSTIFLKGTISILGNGVVIEPEKLLGEMETLSKMGVPLINLILSDRAHLVMPWHKLREQQEELRRGEARIGTTGRGIGPCYADKAAREGLRIIDLTSPSLEARLAYLLKRNRQLLSPQLRAELPTLPALKAELLAFYHEIAQKVRNTESLMADAQQAGFKILLEGAQGTLLDKEFGTYPRVTSSETTRLGAYQGAGLRPERRETVFGVFKGYTTRVGEGPFPTEEDSQVGEQMRQLGNEYGATTGRPRRCGWFDAVLARYAHKINGFSFLVLTKSDVMDEFETVKICRAYRYKGKLIDYPPTLEHELGECEPIYKEMPGWQTSTRGCRRFEDLPIQMQQYCQHLEAIMRVPIGLISVGPRREETIIVRDLGF